MKFILSVGCFLLLFTAQSQTKVPEMDKSPMDMSYWPNNYPLLKMGGKVKGNPIARVIYSRPSKNGRTIFGGILKYNDLWRLGANEATEIEFFSNVTIAGKAIAKGRYTLYCIPTENKWTLILNRDNYSWGAYTYDAKKDVVRTELPVEKNTDTVEAFSMFFDQSPKGANLVILWDDLKVVLPIGR